VANEAGARYAQAFEVRQRCNGGMGSLDIAAAYLQSPVARGTAALLTTGDRMALPRVDRWNVASMGIYGDGGTAAVLSTVDGFARVVSVHTEVDNSLELLARGDEEFAPRPPSGPEPLALDRRARRAVETVLPDAIHRLIEVLTNTRSQVLADAGLEIDQIARTVIPHTRQGRGHRELEVLLGVEEKSTTWEYGKTVGHLASGDQFAGIGWLIEQHLVVPGDHVLVWGGGAGYTCTAAVLEILSVPDWG
jgi:3-oxoacyl-[acyl-carrier-protein] synthase-3